ncbi:MAG: glycosyltransferase [Flavobacteriaceae bacterium]|nr:glycosyltransferase [Flavobacteriaceae bacterium]
MKLSIIVPMYNEEKYIIHCLESLLNQNIPKTEYEILVIDDGSTDNSFSVVKNFSKRLNTSNILIYSKKNGGLSDARNFCIPLAKGKYIYFVDSDDYLASNVLKQLLECLEDNKLDILTFNYINTVDLTLKKSKNNTKSLTNIVIPNGIEHIANNHFHHAVWTYIIEREFLINTKILFVKTLLLEDCVFTPQLFFKANRIAHLPIDVYRYLQVNPNSIMRKTDLSHIDKMINSHTYIMTEINKLIDTLDKNNPIHKKCIDRLQNRQQTLVFFLIAKLIKSNLSIKKLEKTLNELKMLNSYPLNNFISEKYNGMKYYLLSKIFGNKLSLILFTRIYRLVK